MDCEAGIIHCGNNKINSRDRFEILGLCKILHSIKQPRGSVCLEKVLAMHQSC